MNNGLPSVSANSTSTRRPVRCRSSRWHEQAPPCRAESASRARSPSLGRGSAAPRPAHEEDGWSRRLRSGQSRPRATGWSISTPHQVVHQLQALLVAPLCIVGDQQRRPIHWCQGAARWHRTAVAVVRSTSSSADASPVASDPRTRAAAVPSADRIAVVCSRGAPRRRRFAATRSLRRIPTRPRSGTSAPRPPSAPRCVHHAASSSASRVLPTPGSPLTQHQLAPALARLDSSNRSAVAIRRRGQSAPTRRREAAPRPRDSTRGSSELAYAAIVSLDGSTPSSRCSVETHSWYTRTAPARSPAATCAAHQESVGPLAQRVAAQQLTAHSDRLRMLAVVRQDLRQPAQLRQVPIAKAARERRAPTRRSTRPTGRPGRGRPHRATPSTRDATRLPERRRLPARPRTRRHRPNFEARRRHRESLWCDIEVLVEVRTRLAKGVDEMAQVRPGLALAGVRPQHERQPLT